MASSDNTVNNTIKKVKEIDEIIDFSRGETQLKILLHMKNDRPISLTELSEQLGIERRIIADSIQKLKNKGLVKIIRKGEYSLTEEGMRLRSTLLTLGEPSLYKCFNAIKILLGLITIGTKEIKIIEKNKEYKDLRPIWVSLKEISEALNMPPTIIEEIMSNILVPLGYVEEKRLEKDLIDYRLTYKGFKVAKQVLYDVGYSLFAARALSAIVEEPDPLKALKKYFTLYTVLTFITILTAPLYPWHLIPFIFWLIISAYTAALLIIQVKK